MHAPTWTLADAWRPSSRSHALLYDGVLTLAGSVLIALMAQLSLATLDTGAHHRADPCRAAGSSGAGGASRCERRGTLPVHGSDRHARLRARRRRHCTSAWTNGWLPSRLPRRSMVGGLACRARLGPQAPDNSTGAPTGQRAHLRFWAALAGAICGLERRSAVGIVPLHHRRPLQAPSGNTSATGKLAPCAQALSRRWWSVGPSQPFWKRQHLSYRLRRGGLRPPELRAAWGKKNCGADETRTRVLLRDRQAL
jgi:hypothetical protein